MKAYDHKKIEKKWQKEWEQSHIYRSREDAQKPKSYVLDMFPYPSGDGLHVGHPKGYIATDVFARHRRMQGYSVLHPMGWDAFGLPAENFAIKNKIHPRVAVEKNIKRFKEQLSMIGLDYDWSREINTTDPSFYKWTQWIFLKLLEKGLAYQSYEPINWCPTCQTGLSNEDLDGNVCERCGTVVEKRPMRQWILKITDYAERMLEDLKLLPMWQEHIKESQRNWIGKSEGAEIDFALDFGDAHITVFTTRPDTLFGVTYLVLAPEHPWVTRALKHRTVLKNNDEVAAYVESAKKKTELERMTQEKEKTGVKLEGVEAVNPANGEKIPLYVADYVLSGYGTGAIMAVPAHDERDYEFAKKFDLPIRHVVELLVTQTGDVDGIKADLPFEERDAIMAVVKHWSKDEYLCLRWMSIPVRAWVTGGIEKGEDPIEAAKREIREETGYLSPEFVRPLGEKVHARFFSKLKGINRFAHFTPLLFQLKDGSHEEVSEEERAIQEAEWVPATGVGAFINRTDMLAVWDRVQTGDEVYEGQGILVNSGEFDGLTVEEAKEKITEKFGRKKVTYKIRDWVFSRQRYWGEPIPVIHCAKCGVVPVPYEDLPVTLPEVEHYEPTGTGESPLAAISEWVNVSCPKCGGDGKRETNTMPQWAGSSWYYLRYMDPHNSAALVAPDKEKYWAPVDMYVGGAEHATRHLIYARFWHKFLFDIGVVSTQEPFTRLISVGLIQAEDGRKMSKRYGNVINPDDIVETYGADTLRIYEMFMGPFGDAIAWNTQSMIGARRFVERVWKLQENIDDESKEISAFINHLIHLTIMKVGEDIESFKFNTAISQMMILLNHLEKIKITKDVYEVFLQLLAPFAPYVTEELWHDAMGHKDSIHLEPWPAYDQGALVLSEHRIAIQIDGKSRGEVVVAADADKDTLERAAREVVLARLEGKNVVRTIVVPGRLVNFVLEK